ncbi:MAG: AAA family ATPase [Pyrinomonadaceae bacterium]|nr:AAA family ATPase [Pyrinomonadaceae bacterium]
MQSLTFLTLSKNGESRAELRDALVGSGRAHLLADCASPEQMLADVARLRPSAAIITVGPDNSEKEFTLIKKLVAASPDIAIITAAHDPAPALILSSMRSGAREFLQLPINSDEFHSVLDRIAELCAAGKTTLHKSGRVIAVFSGKGGTGASFFGTNLAAAMDVPTLLVDLDLQAGDAASFLGLDTKYSIADFAHNRARLDDSLMASLVTPHSSNLAVLAAPLEAHEAEDIKPKDVSEILHLLRQRYERIVLDLPHTFDPVTVAALDLADDILLVLTLDIPGIRSTRRALKIFDRLDYPRRKIHVVVNRWSKGIDVELKKVETHLGEQLIGFVPNDYHKVMNSINLGEPLVQSDPASKVTIEIKRIAALVSGNGHPPTAHPRKRLLGMFGRQTTSSPVDLSKMLEDMA